MSSALPALIVVGDCKVLIGSVDARPAAIADGNTLLDDVPNETASDP